MHICARIGLCEVEYAEIENFKLFVNVQDKKMVGNIPLFVQAKPIECHLDKKGVVW